MQQILLIIGVIFGVIGEVPTISFKTLEAYQNQQVQIRGFLYQSEEGELILSPEPNLKTCCIGSQSKRNLQIVIRGDIEISDNRYPVTIQGVLRMKGSQLLLDDAFHLPDKKHNFPYLLTGSIVVLAILLSTRSRKIFK